MSTARRLHYTYAEYLALEEESSTRHEYLDGEISALAGGSPDHAALAAAVIGIVAGQLPSGCRMFTSDLRIRIQTTGLSTYPDVAVVCGRTQRAPDDALAVVNPVVLVEVTSASTEDYDRGEKLRQYKRLPSVREVLLVSHREPLLTLHRREDPDAWTTLEARRGEILDLASVSARIAVDEVYRGGLEDSGQQAEIRSRVAMRAPRPWLRGEPGLSDSLDEAGLLHVPPRNRAGRSATSSCLPLWTPDIVKITKLRPPIRTILTCRAR